jgi:uncharacterized protein (TIGR03086 family)
MAEPVDLHPAVRRMSRLVEAVPDDALGRPTPCEAYTVGDLVEHIGGFAVAFRAAAIKEPIDRAGAGDASRLDPDWRTQIPAGLEALADAWDDPEAWGGMTAAGGVDLPGDIAGLIALDELLVHGWDLAVATGQDPSYDGPGLDTVHDLLGGFDAVDGIFGPRVDVPEDAPLLDRTLGLTGRNPAWSPPA